MPQTINGQKKTRYALDINTALPDVLSDGSRTYTYGLGNVSQGSGTATDYFLGDALGSTRQLTDATGQVGLAESYDPFGNPTGSAGTASSILGYAGQQTDSNIKLIYLRSRMYDPATGRFLTKDSWPGDYNRPLSLDPWVYVEGNPINHTDPSGHIPLPGDVSSGKQVYSCNCGWIDFGHANSGLAYSIIQLLNEEGKRFPSSMGSVRNDAFAISPATDIRIWLWTQTVSLTAVVPTGLSSATKDSVALGIYRSLEEQVENTQGSWHEWFTYYSFEDLPSDDIGFYLAMKYGKGVNPAKAGVGKNDLAWNDLANICGFPADRQQAIVESLQAYNEMEQGSLWGEPYMALLTHVPHVYSWGMPLLLCGMGGFCKDGPGRWPAEFNEIAAAQPARNGLWWFYNKVLDGDLVSADKNGQFQYLKY